ncbi:glycoside hydrolase family 32 protein [Tilletiaria anomala UBC 951]|uniref:Glycoside hydrolase family 32 protein n=1 Tax=Tilletiaria anomala (strain ATCC 24038 / CBS 436.72 / UBC 951) TaxID=1037660 RepID=A0A066WMJ0_TILAU|nr:glycoside hydrolase family 32 protein [Tilletiaria anomala UBC 951]KDN52224.1 glycoside hydrolase family 32 protein [Tilletiaria anomala UBC 951]
MLAGRPMFSSLGGALAGLLLATSRATASPYPVHVATSEQLSSSSLFSARQSQSQTAVVPKADISTCATSNGLAATAFEPSLYTEPYRPQIHFSPSSSFMNDPNGLVYRAESAPGADDALWMMSYQYAYNLSVAGNQHWGLATSKDLWHWKHHDPIIAPTAPGNGIFSGSSVVDRNNTSGLFNSSTPPEHRLVAIYTLNTPESQTQHIAYSTDGGFTYTKYAGNPVIEINQTQFRDPKVFWDTVSQRWIMPVSLSQEYAVLFYASPDLKTWQEVGRFSNSGLLGYQYECPGIIGRVPIQGGPKDGQEAHVLMISINPGATSQGGSFIQYFLGDWDGSNFVASDGAARLLEFGPDSYAAQTYDNTPSGHPVLVSWASNWLYTNRAPTSPWRGSFTVPRNLALKWYPHNPQTSAYVLTQAPIDMTPIQGKSLKSITSAPVANQTVPFVGSGAFDINVTFTTANATSNSFGTLSIASESGAQSIHVGVLMGQPAQVFIDRRNASSSFADSTPFFVDRFSTIVMPTYADPANMSSDASITLRAIVDKSVLELYAQDGVAVGTTSFFFDGGADPASVEVLSGENVSASKFTVTALKSTWDCFVQA